VPVGRTAVRPIREKKFPKTHFAFIFVATLSLLVLSLVFYHAQGGRAAGGAGGQGGGGRGTPVRDSDGDGLTDDRERELGTNPYSPDTDGDGLNDGDEVKTGTNPLNPDTDGDGFPDGSDFYPLFDAAIKLTFDYFKGQARDWLINKGGDLYLILHLDEDTFRTPTWNEAWELENFYSRIFNVPDNERTVRVSIEAWDADRWGSDDPYDLGQEASHFWNDRISSVAVEGSVTLYEHTYYTGRSITLTENTDLAAIGWNGIVSSLKVNGQVTVFEHHDFSGYSFTFTRDVPDLTFRSLTFDYDLTGGPRTFEGNGALDGDYPRDEDAILRVSLEVVPMQPLSSKLPDVLATRLVRETFDRYDFNGNRKLELEEAIAFFNWVSTMRYRSDADDGRPGDQYVQKPEETINEEAGDCDDFAALMTAFFNYYGVEAYVALTNAEGPTVDHATCMVNTRDLDRLPTEYYYWVVREGNRWGISAGKYIIVDTLWSRGRFGYVETDSEHFKLMGVWTWSEMAKDYWGLVL
jgi:transglutaminase-like putative cysteine protease